MDKEKIRVALLQCDSYEIDEVTKKINEGLSLLGGLAQWIKPGMNVLLKVNLIGPLPSESAAVTHSEFVRAVIRVLKPLQCNIWVGDSAGGAIGGKSQTGRAFTVSGIEAVAQQEGAVIKNFDKEGITQMVTKRGETMYLAKPLFDADFIINLPKLKTHIAAVYTGAVKNLFGSIPGLKKAEYHKQAQSALPFGEVICDINQSLRAGLNIIDGIQAMDKQGPTSGGIYPAHKIIISTDPLALDTVGAAMIGADIQKLPMYAAVIRENIGESDIGRIEVCGDFSAPPKLPGFRLPRTMGSNSEKSKTLGRLIDLMKRRPEIDLKKCKQCNVCVESCPMSVIDKATKKIDYSHCIECMCCHEMCVHHAIELVNVNPVMRVLSCLKKKS